MTDKKRARKRSHEYSGIIFRLSFGFFRCKRITEKIVGMGINNDRTVSEITRAEGSSKETNGRRSRKNYLECRFFSDTKLDFGMKSAEKFITRALVSLYQKANNAICDAHSEI